MHPVLIDRRRLGWYLAAWVVLAAGLAALLHLVGALSWKGGLFVALPSSLAYAFVCLASWYPVRSLPLDRTGAARLLFTHFSGAAVSTAGWLLGIWIWVEVLDRTRQLPGISTGFGRQVPILSGFGVLLYLLAVSFHHVLAAFEASREAERRALVLNVLAREAELKVLRTQIDPHFLFNALNSIAALTRSEPETARTMCILLADFLRLSMRLGQRERIRLDEELALTRSFLAIEKVRHGNRLRLEEDFPQDTQACLVPPLILQPLVENAVRHGIAHLVDGGVILLKADRSGGRLRLTVENERDPGAVTQRGEGVGLANVRDRLEGLYKHEATLSVHAEGDRFRVEISLPASPDAVDATAGNGEAGPGG